MEEFPWETGQGVGGTCEGRWEPLGRGTVAGPPGRWVPCSPCPSGVRTAPLPGGLAFGALAPGVCAFSLLPGDRVPGTLWGPPGAGRSPAAREAPLSPFCGPWGCPLLFVHLRLLDGGGLETRGGPPTCTAAMLSPPEGPSLHIGFLVYLLPLIWVVVRAKSLRPLSGCPPTPRLPTCPSLLQNESPGPLRGHWF